MAPSSAHEFDQFVCASVHCLLDEESPETVPSTISDGSCVSETTQALSNLCNQSCELLNDGSDATSVPSSSNDSIGRPYKQRRCENSKPKAKQHTPRSPLRSESTGTPELPHKQENRQVTGTSEELDAIIHSTVKVPEPSGSDLGTAQSDFLVTGSVSDNSAAAVLDASCNVVMANVGFVELCSRIGDGNEHEALMHLQKIVSKGVMQLLWKKNGQSGVTANRLQRN